MSDWSGHGEVFSAGRFRGEPKASRLTRPPFAQPPLLVQYRPEQGPSFFVASEFINWGDRKDGSGRSRPCELPILEGFLADSEWQIGYPRMPLGCTMKGVAGHLPCMNYRGVV